LCGAGNEALIVGTDGLRESFEGECDGQEEPELARVTGRAARDIEAAGGGEDNHGDVEGIGENEAGGGGANKFEDAGEKQGQKERGRNGESRKLAGREQGDLTYNDGDRPSEARVGKSLHQCGVGGGRLLSFQLSVLSKEKRGGN